MANEDPNGNAAVVTLAADTRPFDRAMEKAEKDTKSWGERVAKNLSTINLFEASGRFASMKGQVEQLGQMSLDQIGTKLGAGLGAGIGQAAGMAFGGPFGAMAGNFLGGTVGEQVGGKLATGIGDALKNDGLVRDVALAGGRIGDALFSGWGDVWHSSLDDIWEKVKQKAGAAWEEIGTLGLKSLYRLTQGIDSLWGKVREPVAAAANWLQEVAVKLGLVEAGTDKWGDAILNIQDVGKTVVGAIGYGLGYLEGLFVKLGGVIGKHLIAPLTTGLGNALRTASLAVGAVLRDADPVLRAAFAAKTGISLDDIARGLGTAGDKLAAAGAGINAAAGEMEKVDPLDQGDKRRQDALGMLAAGKALADRDKPQPAPAPPAVPLETVKAVLADSREAANIRARSVLGDGQLKALDRIGKNGEEHTKQNQTMIDLLRDLNKNLQDAQVVKPF